MISIYESSNPYSHSVVGQPRTSMTGELKQMLIDDKAEKRRKTNRNFCRDS